jgi:hypothetical protein
VLLLALHLRRSIDLLPPKTAAGVAYTVLLAFQLLMIANAYCPSLLFRLPVADLVAAAATAGGAGAAVAAAQTAPAAAAATVAAAAVAAPTPAVTVAAGAAAAAAGVGVGDPLLRMVKYAWGSGFFVSAFACNCLKTAADRHHSWGPQNRWV